MTKHDTTDVIVAALESGLKRAVKARRWSIVAQLGRELAERELARSLAQANALARQAGVIDLAAARRGRGRPAPGH